MKLIIDISKDRYDEIMAMDWKNCRRFFDEEIRAIHDGKALEQEPCGDAVSRQAVLEVIRKCHCEEWVKADIGAPIEALPSVTPQPKTGQWIVLKDEFDDVCEAVCSCCDKNGNHKWAFCPYCGAKMPEIPTGAEGSE